MVCKCNLCSQVILFASSLHSPGKFSAQSIEGHHHPHGGGSSIVKEYDVLCIVWVNIFRLVPESTLFCLKHLRVLVSKHIALSSFMVNHSTPLTRPQCAFSILTDSLSSPQEHWAQLQDSARCRCSQGNGDRSVRWPRRHRQLLHHHRTPDPEQPRLRTQHWRLRLRRWPPAPVSRATTVSCRSSEWKLAIWSLSLEACRIEGCRRHQCFENSKWLRPVGNPYPHNPHLQI